MAVEVRIPTIFRKFTDGQGSIEVHPGTIADLIEQLDARYPGLKDQVLTEQGHLHRFVNVYVNDEDVRYLDKLETKANEGDTVSLLPSVAGGDGRKRIPGGRSGSDPDR
ncbi:MAG: ubiquitin-like small modifier protein 1 [Actinomycetota bacterium]